MLYNKDVTFIYYTNNLTPRLLLETTLFKAILSSSVYAKELIITSQFKISKYPQLVPKFEEHPDPKLENLIVSEEFFDEKKYKHVKTLVVGRSTPTLKSLAAQILVNLMFVTTKYVVFLEDDILYPYEYFDKIIPCLSRENEIVYYTNSVMFSKEGFFTLDNHMYLSRYSGKTTFFKDHFRGILSGETQGFEPILTGYVAPDPLGKAIEGTRNYTLVSGLPVLDIKHGLNVAGVHVVSQHQQHHPTWGEAKDIIKLISSDGIDKLSRENPMMFVGLDIMTKKNWKPDSFDVLFRFFPDKEMIKNLKNDLTSQKSESILQA